MELIMRLRILESPNADGQYLRRICEYAAQWNDSRTERSLYSWASGAFSVTRKPLLTPGWPTSWPIAVTSKVRASKGFKSDAMGDFGDGATGGLSAAGGYRGRDPIRTRKWKVACKTSTTWRKLW